MIEGLNLYTKQEVNEIISTIDYLIAELSKGVCASDVNPRDVCLNAKDELKDLKYFIEHGSESTNYATKSNLSYPAI